MKKLKITAIANFIKAKAKAKAEAAEAATTL